MRIQSVFFLLGTGLGLSQENYGTWAGYRNVTVNTTSTGANVSGTQVNFPLLVRLGAAQESVFVRSAGDGRDIRFVKNNGVVRLKHQIERWDSAGKSAAVWVLMDTVYGNNATQSFRMYYGKAGAADSSNGAAVFDTANGFQGVFHLAEATDDTARDATVNRFKGVPRNRGGVNPRDTAGAIGRAKNFLGSNADNNGSSYRIVTSTGGNTFDDNALNFQNDSVTRNGLPLYTLSAWIYVTSLPATVAQRKAIIAKSRGVTGQQYHLRLRDPAPYCCDPVLDTPIVDFSDGASAQYRGANPKLAYGTWFHVAAARSGIRGDVGHPENLRVCVNGDACFNGAGLTATTRSDVDVYIGSFSNDSGFFSGLIDEVRFENIGRDTSWLKLAYETQKPGATAVTLGVDNFNPPNPPGLNYLRSSLTLTVNVPMMPDTPVVTGQITAFSPNPALPAGLALNPATGIISGTPQAGQNATDYIVTAIGPGGSAGALVRIAVNAPPQITSQPVNNTPLLLAGFGRAKIGIGATGVPSPVYRWIRTRGTVVDTLTNGGIFSGATTDSLQISYPQQSDSGSTFKCRVVNAVGSAVSQSAVLHVQSPTGIEKIQRIRVGGRGAYSFRLPEGVLSARLIVEALDGRTFWAGYVRVDGNGFVSWNGMDEKGRAVPPGMYVMRIRGAHANP